MKLFLLCLISALLTICAQSSILTAQASGNCPSNSVRVGSACFDIDTGELVKKLRS